MIKQYFLIQSGNRVLTLVESSNLTELLIQASKQNSIHVTIFDNRNKRNPDIIDDFCTHGFKDIVVKVDVVVLAGVLQFFKNSQMSIENAQKVLKPGGRLMFTTLFFFFHL